jgi:uncharacterized membrane-anchored protein YhcB (DUF1043 family)
MKYLSGTALVYALLWLLNLAWGNYWTALIQSAIGVILFIALAVYVNTLDDEVAKDKERVKIEIEKLKKELDELQKKE